MKKHIHEMAGEELASWQDPRIADLELYASQIAGALAALKDRKDDRAAWARGELEAEAAMVRAALDAVPSTQAERDAYRAAIDAVKAARARVEAATEASELVTAEAELTLANRRCGIARAALIDALNAARVPSGVGTLRQGFARAAADTQGTARLAAVSIDLVGYEPGYANRGHDFAITLGRTIEPDQMVWEVAEESRFDPTSPERAAAFALRWQAFAILRGLPYTAPDFSEMGRAR